MLYAGISWHAEGFSVDLVDGFGRRPGPTRRFAGRDTRELTEYLHGFDHLVAVVDSTHAIVEGGLMATGLPLYRGDPPRLDARPLFSAVSATQRAAFAKG